jgi:tRNA A-37 threonylcarbamoyl transferase component Bud32
VSDSSFTSQPSLPSGGPTPLQSFGADGRYTLAREIASGGMASVHLALQRGGAGFNRVVAVKRLRPELADDTEFFSMMIDEARLGSRIQHPNVVAILDVVEQPQELFLVFEYVHGESVARLIKHARQRGEPMPVRIVSAILVGALRGLHHAHHAVDSRGALLGLVHRDISPQNLLVDVTGIAKVADFGIAKAEGRLQSTEFGQVKGKIAYMAPEHLYGTATPKSDVYSMGVVAWEMFASRRLFTGKTRSEIAQAVMELRVPTLRSLGVDLPDGVEQAVMAALDREPAARPASALEFAELVAAELPPASPSEVGAWVREAGGEALRAREQEVRALESTLATPKQPASAPQAVTPPRRRGTGVAIALVAVGVAGAAGAALLFGRGRAGDSTRPPVAPTPEARPAASVSSGAALAPAPSEPVAPSAADAAAPSPSAANTARPAPVRGGGPRKAACNPPTYIDANGVKRYKPECF